MERVGGQDLVAVGRRIGSRLTNLDTPVGEAAVEALVSLGGLRCSLFVDGFEETPPQDVADLLVLGWPTDGTHGALHHVVGFVDQPLGGNLE